MARSGHAISVLTRTAVPDDLHILEEGLPALPQIGVSLAFSGPRPSALAQAFGAHIRDALSVLG
jgi:DNA-binding transcriptional LysR family regulator